MDSERAQFLFGADDPGFDLDDEDELTGFFASQLAPTGDDGIVHSRALIRTVIARQILRDEPAEMWQTVQRLRGLGHARDEVLNQLSIAVTHEIKLALADDGATLGESRDRYRSVLEQLPVPSSPDVVAAVEALVSREQGLPLATASAEILEGSDRADDKLAKVVVDAVIDQGIERGALSLLSGDRLVFPKALTDGIVLTHRLNESELELEVLSCVGTDLGGYAWRDDLSWGADDDDAIEVFSVEFGHVGWRGPEGWLREFAVGDLLAVHVDHDGMVRIEKLDADPLSDDDLVERLRHVYEDDIAEVGLPSLCTDLTFALLVDDPTTFDRPRLPLRELCERAGLELRGGFVAHGEELWHAQSHVQRASRVHDAFDDDHELAQEVLDALAVADDPDATPEQLRATLARLHDPEVCWGVLDELFDPDDADPDQIAAADAFAQRLVGAARRPTERMLAHWVSGIVAERAGDVREADAHLQIAMQADPEWGPLVDRAAWYASDRGDASRAASLWRTLEAPDDEELRIVEACARRVGAKRGRNDPCWCGSGRKLKLCHAGAVEPIPLPDRVLWLASKAVGYLMRHGGDAVVDLADLAAARAVDAEDRDDLRSMIGDPIVIDAALTELGWFERFLRDRGPLLSDDEALLATTWLLVDRTVYEVEATRPGDGLVVRDIRTGDQLDVRERTMSAQAAAGQMVCARAVPDGATHQFVGSVFHVPPGREREVLELCDDGDAFALCEYVASRQRPPRLATREGEPLVSCTLALRVPDPLEARRVLDEEYECDGDGWVEMHEISDDERILRAQLTLDEDTLTVSTHSEPRVERVLARLRAAIPHVEIVSDERVPLRPGELPQFRVPLPGAPGAEPADPDDPAVRDEITDLMEQRWLRESVPALGGATPLEAATDPTRREELERLLASFPEPTDGPFLTLRPSRLRALLGLSEPSR